MNEMTLPYRHRIRNSTPVVWGRALSHRDSPRYWIFMSDQKNWMPARGSNTRSPTFQADTFNHCTRINECISLIKESINKIPIYARLHNNKLKVIVCFFMECALNTQNWSKTAIFYLPHHQQYLCFICTRDRMIICWWHYCYHWAIVHL